LDEFAGRSTAAEEETPDGEDEGSLDQVGDSSDEPAEDAPSGPMVESGVDERTDSDGVATEIEDVQPVASTYAWSPEGGPCAACGEHVEERWREGEELVCVDCKAW